MARPRFKGDDYIYLQPGDSHGYTFRFTTESAQYANDGFIPYGRTATSVAVKAFNSADEDKTSELISGTPSIAGAVVTAHLKWPTSGADTYKLEFVLTLDNTQTIEVDLDRVKVYDF